MLGIGSRLNGLLLHELNTILVCYCTKSLLILYKQINKSLPKRWEPPCEMAIKLYLFATNIINNTCEETLQS